MALGRAHIPNRAMACLSGDRKINRKSGEQIDFIYEVRGRFFCHAPPVFLEKQPLLPDIETNRACLSARQI
tara:strand:- start:7170 stop:7382 length:213 start_codon:yes stop_codon:yes gene_type:complete